LCRRQPQSGHLDVFPSNPREKPLGRRRLTCAPLFRRHHGRPRRLPDRHTIALKAGGTRCGDGESAITHKSANSSSGAISLPPSSMARVACSSTTRASCRPPKRKHSRATTPANIRSPSGAAAELLVLAHPPPRFSCVRKGLVDTAAMCKLLSNDVRSVIVPTRRQRLRFDSRPRHRAKWVTSYQMRSQRAGRRSPGRSRYLHQLTVPSRTAREPDQL